MTRRGWSAVFIAYALLVAWVSLREADTSIVGNYDKLGHFVVYGLFAWLGLRLGLRRGTYAVLCLAIVGYSGLLEYGQSFVPGRMMSGFDLLANAAGVLLGALVGSFLGHILSGRDYSAP